VTNHASTAYGQDSPRYLQPPWIYEWGPLALLAALAVALTLYPVLRAFFRLEVNYNEGWNVYNAVAADRHLPLYGEKYGWRTVNYPALSFYVVAWLHRAGLAYLTAGRILSLLSFLASCILVGLITWRFCRDYRSALFSAFFCCAIFCIAANEYVASDDPQVFAQVFFLSGFLVYISGRPVFYRLACVSLLFVLGGNIKHNLIEFPLAVLIDLALIGRKPALQYLSVSGVLLGASIYLNTIAGGPFFLANILNPRSYSFQKASFQFLEHGFGPVALAMIAALAWSAASLKQGRVRVLAILFLASLTVGFVSGGGIGVWVNSYFDIYLSVAVIMGLIFHGRLSAWPVRAGAGVSTFRAVGSGKMVAQALACDAPPVRAEGVMHGQIARGRLWAPAGLATALLVPFIPVWIAGPPLFLNAISGLTERQRQFDSEVSFLRSHPGPAFCESLLLCYEAGKSYEYDPFNSANLVKIGRLDPAPLLNKISQGQIADVQLCCSLDFLKVDDDPDIIPQMLPAIEASYQLHLADGHNPYLTHEGCYVYIAKGHD
jgi:hypothetical protein